MSDTSNLDGSSLFPVPIADIIGTFNLFACSTNFSLLVTVSTASTIYVKDESIISSSGKFNFLGLYISTFNSGLISNILSFITSILGFPIVVCVA